MIFRNIAATAYISSRRYSCRMPFRGYIFPSNVRSESTESVPRCHRQHDGGGGPCFRLAWQWPSHRSTNSEKMANDGLRVYVPAILYHDNHPHGRSVLPAP